MPAVRRRISARRALSACLVVLALMVPSVPAEAAPGPRAGEAATCDALCVRVRRELADFTGWLARSHSQGFIGEVGWPDDRLGDARQWSALAEAWYSDADAAGLWATAWATGEWWGTSYPLTPYEDRLSGEGVDSADVQASVLEAHPTTGAVLRGVNVAGAEFGAPVVGPSSPFSNLHPGVPETAYHYDSQATFDYLASRGVRLVRLPVRWERLQRAPLAPLDGAEVARLRAALARAGASGLQVVVDVHNYGSYYLDDGIQGVRRAIGSPELPVAAFADLWSRLSAAVTDAPGLLGYGLMNEPVAMPTVNGQSPPKLWEHASQAAVDAIRATGDRRVVLVPGYQWSGAQRWSEQHPTAWISDPVGRVRYEAHHYWDGDNSGAYPSSYDQELADARARGYADEVPVPPAQTRQPLPPFPAPALPPAVPSAAPPQPPPPAAPARRTATCRPTKRRRCRPRVRRRPPRARRLARRPLGARRVSRRR